MSHWWFLGASIVIMAALGCGENLGDDQKIAIAFDAGALMGFGANHRPRGKS